jgi:hypothetical protein
MEATMTKRHERGAGNVGCVLGLLVMVVIVVVLVKAIPVKVAVAELKDTAVKEAESASMPRHDDGYVRGQVIIKAQKLGLPFGEDQVKVWRDTAMMHIEYAFTVPIDFPLYTYQWHIEEKIERVLF